MLAISFICYSLAIAAFGLFSTRYSRNTEADFLLADRGLGAWVAALSASASAESGWVTLGLVGLAFTDGVAAFWIVPGTVLAFLFNWFVLAPKLLAASHDGQALTLTDVLATKYSARIALGIRLVSILVCLTMLTGYVAAQFNAAGKAFSATFGWSYESSVMIGAGLVLIYTVTGGFRAIAWTDVVQSVFMIFAMVAVPILLISLIGGPSQFFTGVRNTGTMGHPFAGRTGTLAIIALMSVRVGVPLGNAGQPHMLVRLMAVKDERARRRGAVISTVWVCVLFCGAVVLGMAARIYYGTLPDPEKALPHIAADPAVMSPIVGGMLIAAILAAVCSTADSQLLVAASSISHDFLVKVCGLGPKQADDQTRVARRRLLDRGSVVVLGIIATLIAVGEVRSVFDFVLAAWDGLGATFGPALILVLLVRRSTGPGVLAAMITGALTAVLWRQFPQLHKQVYGLIPAFAGALTVGWIASLLTNKQPSEE